MQFNHNNYDKQLEMSLFFICNQSPNSTVNMPSQAVCFSHFEICVCMCVHIHSFIHSFIHQYSALEAGLAGCRAQSCDRYGSGTLHPGHVLGGSLPLLSPTFGRSHIRCQVPVRPQRRERSQQRKVELWATNCQVILPKFQLPRKFRDLLHAANL